MNAARDPSRLADAVADLKDPEMIKSAREMMAQAEPAFQVEMQRMMYWGVADRFCPASDTV